MNIGRKMWNLSWKYKKKKKLKPVTKIRQKKDMRSRCIF